LIEGDEGPAEVIKLRHEALHWRGLTPMVPFPRRSPHSIYANGADPETPVSFSAAIVL
jgi:hypothetical protein